MKSYALANNDGFPSIWWGIQGEAHLRGLQMAFIRLAGCDINCSGCDTDYSFGTKMLADNIALEACKITPKTIRDRWVWITGGEPSMHDLRPLINSLRKKQFSIAVATSGNHRVIPPVDWLSVSPHIPNEWVQTYGNEVKIVPGLNGYSIDDFIKLHPDSETDFMYRYVQPLWDKNADREDPCSMKECITFLKHNPNWSLSRQDHKFWFADTENEMPMETNLCTPTNHS